MYTIVIVALAELYGNNYRYEIFQCEDQAMRGFFS